MLKKLAIASAVSAALAATPAVFAQQQQQQQGQGQIPSQQLAQEQTQAPGSPIYISTAGVRQIQQALNRQGFDTGAVDGQWSQQTSQAARDFQRSQGIEPTGTLTLALINALGQNNLLAGTSGAQGGQGMQWAQEQAQGPGTPLHISTASVRQIQQRLNQRGYDVGNIDGQWNQSTSRAAANFQQANGLEPNGKPDVNLIAALGLRQQVMQGQAATSGGGQGMQWQQEQAAGPGTQLWASPATVRQIQQALNQQGFDVGAVNGQWGQQTSNAVQRFQRAQGMEPTGTLTTNLMAGLGMQNWMSGQAQASGGGQQQSGGGQMGQGQQGGGQQQSGGGQMGQQGQQGGGQQQSGGGQMGQGQQGGGQQQSGGGHMGQGQQGGGQQQSGGGHMGQGQQGGQQQSGGGQMGQGQQGGQQQSGGGHMGQGQQGGQQQSGGGQMGQGQQGGQQQSGGGQMGQGQQGGQQQSGGGQMGQGQQGGGQQQSGGGQMGQGQAGQGQQGNTEAWEIRIDPDELVRER